MKKRKKRRKHTPRQGPPSNLRPAGPHKDRREQQARKLLEDLRQQLVTALGEDTTDH